MNKKLILFGAVIMWIAPCLSMEQKPTAPAPELTPLSIQDLIDRDEVPEAVEIEFMGIGPILGYMFFDIGLTSLQGIENLPEIEDVQALIFEDNKISEISAPDFEAVPNLIVLEILNNPLRTIAPGTFDQLTNLKILKFHSVLLANLPTDIFNSQRDLEELTISRCMLQQVTTETFKNLFSLKALELRHNQLTEFDAKIIADMHELQALNLSHNKLITASSALFSHSKIRIVNLSDNPITYLDPSAINAIQANKIWTGLPPEIVPIKPRSVSDVLAEGDNIPWVDGDNFLNINFEQLTSLDGLEQIAHVDKVEHLLLNHNYLDKMPDLSLWEICPKLKTLSIANNRISVLDFQADGNPLDAEQTVRRPLLELNLQANNIERIEPGALRHFPELRDLNLRNNKISALGAHALKGATLLRTLNLSENQLVALDESAFAPCSFLVNINLNNNDLTYLPPTLFKDLLLTEEILLAYNRLANVDKLQFSPKTYVMKKPQQLPKLELLAALKAADSFAKLSVEQIAHLIQEKKMGADALELIFQVSTNATKDKIHEAALAAGLLQAPNQK